MNNPEQAPEGISDEEQAVKEFSRQESIEERSRVAQEIIKKRQEYFSIKNNLTEKILQLENEITEKRILWDEVTANIQSLEEENSNSINRIYNKVLDLLKIRSLNDILVEVKDQEESLQLELSKNEEVLASLKEQILNKDQLNEAKDMLKQFYLLEKQKYTSFLADQESKRLEEYEMFLEDEKERDLTKVMSEQKVAFCHGIIADFRGGNSIIREGVSWQNRMDIVLALGPTLACCTTRENQNSRNLWSPVGFVLGKGRIEAANAQDVGSLAEGVNKRVQNTSANRIKEDIDDSISSYNQRYNEFSISNPLVAGMYVCLDPDAPDLGDEVSGYNIVGYAQKRGLPVYGLFEGQLYHCHFAGKFIKDEIVDFEEIKNAQGIPEEGKQGIFEEALQTNLYKSEKLKLDELNQFISYNSGRSLYLELSWRNLKLPEDIKKEEIIVHTNGRDDKILAPVIGEINIYERNYKYFISNNNLMRSWEADATNKSPSLCRIDDDNNYSVELGSGYISGFVHTRDNYVPCMQKIILEYKNDQKTLIELAYHMRGTQEEALKWGDKEFAQECGALLETIISQESQDEMLKRRMGKKGEFILSMEDLRK